MEAVLFVYLAALLGNLGELLMFGCLISGFALVVSTICYQSCEDGYKSKEEIKEDRKTPTKIFKIAGILMIVFGLAKLILPEERTMYFMAGAYIGQQAVTSEVSKDLQDILELKLKSYKQELEKELVK